MAERRLAEKRLAVVILHYGQPELTRRLADQLAGSDPDWAVRVLDNHAPIPFPGAWQRLPDNLFWAGALAWCLDELGREGFTHLWFLNNDLYFGSAPSHLGRAWERLHRLDQILGPVGVYSPSATANPYHPQMVQQPGLQFSRAALIDGIAPLFNLECLTALGGLDFADNSYGYGVDVWTSLCAHRAGWPVVVDHAVCIRHVYHSTARKVEGFLAQAARAEAAYLSRRLGPNYAAELMALKAEVQGFEKL